ncbi:MAG: DNA-directed RNA polymerase subunit D [Nitrospiraceae bacterium]|nr:DNA-directed RNA polymerase subunit D [Nitrospiraceae bacterium]
MDVILINNDEKEGKLSLLLQGVNYSFVNALRRSIVSRVPVMAIEDVEISKNSSGLYDEMLAHRLGLIPLKTDIDSYNFRDKCSCGGVGCSLCEVTFTLKAKGPKMVYASDLVSSDPKIVAAQPKMPIVKLLENQEVDLVAKAILGTGKEHAKWSPGLVYYKNKPIISVKNEKCENAEEVVNACPKHIFAIKNKKLVVDVDKVMDCKLCDACTDVSDCVELVKKDDEFIFNVESWGQLGTFEMVRRGVDVIVDLADDFVKSIGA